MQVSRTIANRDVSVQPDTKIISGVALETRYAFSSKLEAMFASGVVSTLLRRELSGGDTYTPGYMAHQKIDRDSALDLREAIRLRAIGFGVPTAMDGVEPFLTHEQSTNLWNAIDWASTHKQRVDAIDDDNGFASVVAGAVVLREAVLGVEHTAYLAGIDLLASSQARGLRRLSAHGLPDVVISHTFAPDTEMPGSQTVTIVTASELLAS